MKPNQPTKIWKKRTRKMMRNTKQIRQRLADAKANLEANNPSPHLIEQTSNGLMAELASPHLIQLTSNR